MTANRYAVVFAPEAEAALASLYDYIAEHGSPMRAERYTNALLAHCESLAVFPHRAAPRDDVRAGLRVTNYKGRTVIAFEIDELNKRVAILGFFYGGRDYETAIAEDDAPLP